MTTSEISKQLEDEFSRRGLASPASWSFKGNDSRYGAHSLLHYPAMMVPSLQGSILDVLRIVSPQCSSVLDPFVGSGTVLTESMERGLNFTGIDINPLAGLTCIAKSGPYHVEKFSEKATQLHERILLDKSRQYFTYFPKQAKWFSKGASESISRIARSIEKEPDLWARRLFWLALAKVIRFSSNSRISTYKLHIRSNEDLLTRKIDVHALFKSVIKDFIKIIKDQSERLTERNLIDAGEYVGAVDIKIGNSLSKIEDHQNARLYDIIMTSPPYGDNRTTVPYGQFSYLPMQWIPLEDIQPDISQDLLSSSYSIDYASLGGSLKEAKNKLESLNERYKSARRFTELLKANDDGIKRFSTFFHDFERSVKACANVTNVGGFQSWTTGNRRIGGFQVPMGDLLIEMLEHHGLSMVSNINRPILSKKMASKNNVSETMTHEDIIIAFKPVKTKAN